MEHEIAYFYYDLRTGEIKTGKAKVNSSFGGNKLMVVVPDGNRVFHGSVDEFRDKVFFAFSPILFTFAETTEEAIIKLQNHFRDNVSEMRKAVKDAMEKKIRFEHHLQTLAKLNVDDICGSKN